jgi:hypothetical protein
MRHDLLGHCEIPRLNSLDLARSCSYLQRTSQSGEFLCKPQSTRTNTSTSRMINSNPSPPLG